MIAVLMDARFVREKKKAFGLRSFIGCYAATGDFSSKGWSLENSFVEWICRGRTIVACRTRSTTGRPPRVRRQCASRCHCVSSRVARTRRGSRIGKKFCTPMPRSYGREQRQLIKLARTKIETRRNMAPIPQAMAYPTVCGR